MKIEINATSDATQNWNAIQQAVNDDRIDLITLRGKFNFGRDDSFTSVDRRRTVQIRRGVRIRGEGLIRNPLLPFSVGFEGAQILGGGEVLSCAVGLAESGAFKVMNDGPGDDGLGNNEPVIFENIWFDAWKGQGILAEACRGLVVERCRFTSGRPGRLGDIQTLEIGTPPAREKLRVTNAIFATGPDCIGDLLVENNECSYGSYPTINDTPHNEKFLACAITHFSEIRVVGNTHSGHDDGIEIMWNDQKTRRICVNHNVIKLADVVPEGWPGHAGIACFKNGMAETEIIGNKVAAKGPFFAFGLSDNDITAKNNHAELLAPDPTVQGTYPLAGFILGYNRLSPNGIPRDVGRSLNDSAIVNNSISGTAVWGIMTYDDNDFSSPAEPNESHDNVIKYNDMSKFRPAATDWAQQMNAASLYLSANTHDNVCIGEFPPRVINGGERNRIAP